MAHNRFVVQQVGLWLDADLLTFLCCGFGFEFLRRTEIYENRPIHQYQPLIYEWFYAVRRKCCCLNIVPFKMLASGMSSLHAVLPVLQIYRFLVDCHSMLVHCWTRNAGSECGSVVNQCRSTRNSIQVIGKLVMFSGYCYSRGLGSVNLFLFLIMPTQTSELLYLMFNWELTSFCRRTIKSIILDAK